MEWSIVELIDQLNDRKWFGSKHFPCSQGPSLSDGPGDAGYTPLWDQGRGVGGWQTAGNGLQRAGKGLQRLACKGQQGPGKGRQGPARAGIGPQEDKGWSVKTLTAQCAFLKKLQGLMCVRVLVKMWLTIVRFSSKSKSTNKVLMF